MSDSRKDRKDRDRGGDKAQSQAQEMDKGKSFGKRFRLEDDFDWHKYTGNVKDIKLGEFGEIGEIGDEEN